ncbi:MAG: hypothetical protein JKX72_01900 [Robiginitomaculum sp.]|nr:hypothetical protein [Robiginitomaculum sp.]
MTGGANLVELSQEIRDTLPKQTGHFKFAGTLEWPALRANLDKVDAIIKLKEGCDETGIVGGVL